MIIVVSYNVDKDLYDSFEHCVSLVTTEFTYKREMLVHLQFGKNLIIRLNNRIQNAFQTGNILKNEQFLFKKTYHHGAAKPTSRSTFEEKKKRFDMSQTAVEVEILEEYSYVGQDGNFAETQIVITSKDDTLTATIDFENIEQHRNFISPAWLTPLS